MRYTVHRCIENRTGRRNDENVFEHLESVCADSNENKPREGDRNA